MGKSEINPFAMDGFYDLWMEFQRVLDRYDDIGQQPICRNDPELFYHEGQGGNNREAKAACAMCPLRDPCATYAIVANERIGTWGGLSPRERHKIRKDALDAGTMATIAEVGYYAAKRAKLQARTGHTK